MILNKIYEHFPCPNCKKYKCECGRELMEQVEEDTEFMDEYSEGERRAEEAEWRRDRNEYI